MKTAAISDSPTIGIVSTHQSWAQLLAEGINRPGLIVNQISPSQLTQNDCYKIIWLVDPGQTQTQELITTMSLVNKPLLVVFPFVSPALTDPDKTNPAWSNYHLHERQVLADLMKALPSAVFVFIPNLILPAPLQPLFTDLVWLISPLEKGLLFDPDISTTLTGWKEAADSVADLVIRPHLPDRILLSPPQISSDLILKEIQSASIKQNGDHPDILTRPIKLDFAYPPTDRVQPLHTSPRQTLYGFLNQIELPCAVTKPEIPQPTVLAPQSTESPLNSLLTPLPTPLPHSPLNPLPPTRDSVLIPSPISAPTPSPHDFSLSQSLSSIFTHTNAVQQQDYLTKITKTEIKEGKRSGRRKRLFVFGSASVGVALLAIMLFGAFSLNLNLVKNHLVNRFDQSDPSPNWQTRAYPWLTSTLQVQTNIYNALFSNPRLEEAQAVVNSTQLLAQAEQQTQLLQTTGQNLVAAMLGVDDTSEIEPTAQNVALHSRSAYELWSQLQASTAQIDLSDKAEPTDGGQTINQTTTQTDQRLKNLIKLQKLSPVFTKLAQTPKTTVAVLFQNSQELRPTGGFIQAVAILNFERGRLVAYSTHSSYSLDTKISGQVAAPDDIRAILGESNFYFRDSNWDGNFPTSMQKSGWFLDKALNKQIDGIIALNTISLPTLLSAIGPVELPSYNEVITPANVAERLEFHSEIQLTPGSQDYTTTLLDAMLTNIKNLKPDKYPALARAMSDMLDEQGVLIAFDDKDSQQNLTELGWTGALLTPPCPAQFTSPDCFVDTIAQVEANVGINKANYYLEKNQTHYVTLTPSSASHDLTTRYTNTAKSNAWPRGPYKAYVRLYLPEGTTGVEIEFNQTKLAGQSIKTYTEYSKQVWAFSLEVPVNSSRDLRVRYHVPLTSKSANQSDKLSYVLFEQKQPGTGPMPVKTTIQLSDDLSPTLIAPQAEVLNKTIIFHATSQSHLLYGVLAN